MREKKKEKKTCKPMSFYNFFNAHKRKEVKTQKKEEKKRNFSYSRKAFGKYSDDIGHLLVDQFMKKGFRNSKGSR